MKPESERVPLFVLAARGNDRGHFLARLQKRVAGCDRNGLGGGVNPAGPPRGWHAQHAAADAPAVAGPDLRRDVRRDRRRPGSASRAGGFGLDGPERCPALKRCPFQPSVSRRSRVSTRSYRPASGFDLPPQSTHPARSCPGDQCPSAQRAADRGRQCGHGVTCLLYTSDAADERSCVDLGGRRLIKKKHTNNYIYRTTKR